MREMLFSNNVHHNGINVTVRRGDKWSMLRNGEKVIFSSADEHREAPVHATIVAALKMPFYLIPESLLEHEHDETCRTRENLLKELQHLYGGFMATEAVTVVLYFITEE